MSIEEIQPRRRRAARSVDEIKQLLAAYEQKEMGGKEFCRLHNIGASTLQKWKSRYGGLPDGQGKKEEAPAQDGFIPVQIVPPVLNNAEGLFAEVKGIKLYQPVAASYLKELLQ